MSGDQCPFLSLSRVNIVRIEVGKWSSSQCRWFEENLKFSEIIFQVRLDSCSER